MRNESANRLLAGASVTRRGVFYLARRVWLLSCIVAVVFSGHVSAQSPSAENREEQKLQNEDTPMDTEDGAEDDSVGQREEEAPLEAAEPGTSALDSSIDYEPSEAISEDRSVSFPVDI